MEYSTSIGLVIFVLVHFICNANTITHRRNIDDHVRISRAQGGEPPITDWEIGLREAAHQALLRDGYANPSLHEYLQNAPIAGKQAIKAFGDIAILARGQLYATPVGFNFVQDPYHNDCDECHNGRRRCQGQQCNLYKVPGPEQLVALWTVKRIRHRDDDYGHRYEIEYTISPVDKALKDGFITTNGRFDYGIPGYVFVIRSNLRYTNGYEHNKFFSSPDQLKWHRQYIPPDRQYVPAEHYPNVLITHGHKPPITNIYQTPGTDRYEATQSTTDPKEIQLYRNLINSLAAKTSTTDHRFKIEAQSTSPKTSIDRITPATLPSKTTYQISTTGPPQRTTLVQLPTGQIVPLTEISATTQSEGQLQILTPVQVGPFQAIPVSTNGIHLIPTQPMVVSKSRPYPTSEPTILSKIPSTQVPIFIMKELVPPSVRPEVVKDMGSTKLPKKTTIHFFAAEDDEKSTQKDGTTDDIFKPTKKYSARKKFTKPPTRKTTKSDYDDDDNFDLFPAVKSTEPMRKTTDIPFRETSPSVDQVPRPYKDTATTLPYSSSTSPITQQYESSFGRKTTIPVSDTTRVPTTYGTQSTRITLPIPSTAEQETTRSTIHRTPTLFTKIQTTAYQDTTSAPSTSQGTSRYDYNVVSTVEPRESIITVTPVQTVAIGHTNFDEATLSTLGYPQRRFNTASNTEYTTEERESQLDNSVPKTTFIYPSSGSISTTYPPRSFSTTLEENPSTRRVPTQSYTTNTEQLLIRNEYNTTTIPTTVTEYNQQTHPHSFAFPSTETVPVESTLSPTTKLTRLPFDYTKPTGLPTTKFKPTKTTRIENDFLVEDTSGKDNSEPISKNKSKFQDYTDDDIFGPINKSNERKLGRYKLQASGIYRTDFTTEPTRTVAKTPKIIYSDFFEASTVPPTTSLTQFRAESQNNFITSPLDATTQRLPLTSQSYLTSISYKVNRKNVATLDEIEILPTIRAKLSNVVSNGKLQVFKAELPDTDENATHKVSDKEAFDNIALQLVNHARSLDLLNKIPEEVNKNKTMEGKRNPKYKRRNYLPKSRRNQKGKEMNKN